MLHSPSQIRVVLFVVAGLLGLAATYIRFADLLPLEPSYVASATYRSDLLADTLSMYAVQSVVDSAEFQRTAGARIAIASISGKPSNFRLNSSDPVQQRAESGLDNARELLRIKLRALALAEVEASRGYLEQLKDEARIGRRTQSQELKSRSKPVGPTGPVLSSTKKERAVLLRREIGGLEKFLRYKQRPDWFDARVDSGALRGAQRDVEEARLKQRELQEVFTATSAAAKAQAKVVAKKQNQLWALEKHLASALLRSHRNELKGMEAGALVAVKQAQAQPKPEPTVEPTPDDSPDDDWLRAHSEQLAAQFKVMEKKASLQQLSDPTTQLTRPLGYWLGIGLWVGSLTLLVGALFVRPVKRSVKRSAKPSAKPSAKAAPARLDTKGKDQFAPSQQLSELLLAEARNLRHLLVLGRQGAERSSLSLRLAQQLGQGGQRIRLVDFDFPSRPLSERVGDPVSPGVSDLLTRAGPPEEFFASLPGTTIQFAPAGTSRSTEVSQGDVEWLFPAGDRSLTVIDAGFSSPLHLFLARMDAVVCLYQPGTPWSAQETDVLNRLRTAGRPIWGVALDGSVISQLL